MDPRLLEALTLDEGTYFKRLVKKDRNILFQQNCDKSLDTILHLAARMESVESARRIVELCPDLVAMENALGETPLHEVCRNGNVDIAKLLLESNPWVALTRNHANQNAFSIACRGGHVRVLMLLLSQLWLVDHEEERMDSDDLLSTGNAKILLTILQARPKFAWKSDKDGCILLHRACERKQLEITRLLLEFAPDTAYKLNRNGYTPLHFAAMNGDIAILDIFLPLVPTSFHCPTAKQETVFHLAAKFGKYEAFVHMAEVFRHSDDLLQRTDINGNTALHLAVSACCYQLADYMIKETDIDVKLENLDGQTAIDLVNNRKSILIPTVVPKSVLNSGNDAGNKPDTQILVDAPTRPEANPLIRNESSDNWWEQISSGRSESDRRKHPTNRRYRKEPTKQVKSQRNRQYETQREGLQNARNTIIVVAILIASVAFTVGLNPPGGVYQDDRTMKGKAIAGKRMAFKIFAISNSIALFTSLCMVIILVSIIPFERKKLMKLMVITHKVMWVAVSFMATAFVAAGWVIIPHDQDTWMVELLIAVGGGSMTAMFIYLGVHMVRHWLRKMRWRKHRESNDKIKTRKTINTHYHFRQQPESSNSDIESAKSLGYHTF